MTDLVDALSVAASAADLLQARRDGQLDVLLTKLSEHVPLDEERAYREIAPWAVAACLCVVGLLRPAEAESCMELSRRLFQCVKQRATLGCFTTDQIAATAFALVRLGAAKEGAAKEVFEAVVDEVKLRIHEFGGEENPDLVTLDFALSHMLASELGVRSLPGQ